MKRFFNIFILMISLTSVSLFGCGGGTAADSGEADDGGGEAGAGSSTPDATPPSIESASQTDGATAASTDDPLTIIFNEEMDDATITTDTIKLTYAATGEEVSGEVALTSNNVATFTPSIDLDFLTAYTLTITTGVKDPSGNSQEQEYEVDFTTSDGRWRTAKTLGSDWLWPAVVMDGNTNALFAGSIPNGDSPGIYAMSYAASTWTWSDETAIGSGVILGFKLDMNTSGDAMAIWSLSGRTYVARYSRTSGWEDATAIDTTADATTYGFNDIEIDEDGNAVAVFAETHPGPVMGLSVNTYTAATDSWGTPASLWNDGVFGQLAMNANGDAMVVGTPLASGGYTNAKASRYSSGSWSASVTINSDSHDGTVYTAPAQVAMDPSGNTIAVWVQDNNIWTNIYNVSTNSWGTAGLLDTGSGAASVPQIAFDNDGNAIAVWQQSDGTYTNIYYNRYNGSAWGGVTLLSDATSNATDPQIVIDKNNNAIVVWAQSNGVGIDAYAVRYVASTALWGTPEVIDNTAYDVHNPQIAVGGNGTATAVWYQQNEGTITAGANRFR